MLCLGRRSCCLWLQARLAALQVKEGCRHLYPCIRRSLRSVGYAKYSFVQALVTALMIAGLPLLVALGAFGVYAAAGFASVLAFVVGNLLILKVYSAYRPGFVIRKRVVGDMMPAHVAGMMIRGLNEAGKAHSF